MLFFLKLETHGLVGGKTPLFQAAYRGSNEIAQLLIEKGADVNAKTKKEKMPLNIAVRRGHDEVADLLRKHGAKE